MVEILLVVQVQHVVAEVLEDIELLLEHLQDRDLLVVEHPRKVKYYFNQEKL